MNRTRTCGLPREGEKPQPSGSSFGAAILEEGAAGREGGSVRLEGVVASEASAPTACAL